MKIIINADDFGPIDFVNEGIYAHVRAGNLDSVQTLSNGDENHLHESFRKLHDSVPAGRKLEVGVHFTLTSGGPIVGDTETVKAQRWGEMVEQVNGKVQFKDYSKFYFGYAGYLPLIREEFLAQRERIERLVNLVNQEKGNSKLFVTSASSHHNLLTIAEDVFEVYVESANGLRLRSPKMKPVGTANTYYGLVLPLFNATDRKEQRQKMAAMNKAFAENKYLGPKTIEIPSPAYIDVQFYKNLGSLGVGKVTKAKIKNRMKQFEDMVNEALQYRPNTVVESHQKIVEFVFHLGQRNAAMGNTDYSQLTNNYTGVTHKYFDNREVEVAALEALCPQYGNYIKEFVSWEECGIVKYL